MSEGNLVYKGSSEKSEDLATLLISFVIGIVVGGAFMFIIFNSSLATGVIGLEDYNASVARGMDFNSLREEHLALASNQVYIVEVLGVLQEQRLCGTNQIIPDSNRFNEVPRGVIYSCFAPVQSGVS